MPERCKVVCIPCKALYKPFTYLLTYLLTSHTSAFISRTSSPMLIMLSGDEPMLLCSSAQQLVIKSMIFQLQTVYLPTYLQLIGPRGSAVERQSLASVLSPSCTRPVADG